MHPLTIAIKTTDLGEDLVDLHSLPLVLPSNNSSDDQNGSVDDSSNSTEYSSGGLTQLIHVHGIFSFLCCGL